MVDFSMNILSKKTNNVLSAHFADELLQVKTVDNKLLVHAKHEESGGGKAELQKRADQSVLIFSSWC